MTADDGGGSARALLLDIEGTTTPIAFVVSVLFPYARARLEDFISDNAGAPEIDVLIADLRIEHAAAASAGEPVVQWRDDTPVATRASACSFGGWLMDRDRKSTALKELQGRIWEHGYRSGALVGQVFPDVPEALRRWRAAGRRAAIFSSGSVLAQRLLFGHSTAGDLTPLLSAYFDTTTGPKGEASSYVSIAGALELPPASVLFVSDVTRELDAARAAGMLVRLAIRPGNAPATDASRFVAIHSFDEIG